jgi:hypothetical protein
MSLFLFFLSVFWRVGLWQALNGAKGAFYAWALTGSVLLPVTIGIALMTGIRSWRPFVGWWLIFAAHLVVVSFFWFAPVYRIWPDLFVCEAVVVPPLIVCGLVLVLWRSGSKDRD